jgi:hypothetical protein
VKGSTLKEKPATCDLQTFNRNWVVPRRELFVPVVDEGFFVLLDDGPHLHRAQVRCRPWTISHGPSVMVHGQASKGGTNEKRNSDQFHLLERRPSSSAPPYIED